MSNTHLATLQHLRKFQATFLRWLPLDKYLGICWPLLFLLKFRFYDGTEFRHLKELYKRTYNPVATPHVLRNSMFYLEAIGYIDIDTGREGTLGERTICRPSEKLDELFPQFVSAIDWPASISRLLDVRCRQERETFSVDLAYRLMIGTTEVWKDWCKELLFVRGDMLQPKLPTGEAFKLLNRFETIEEYRLLVQWLAERRLSQGDGSERFTVFDAIAELRRDVSELLSPARIEEAYFYCREAVITKAEQPSKFACCRLTSSGARLVEGYARSLDEMLAILA